MERPLNIYDELNIINTEEYHMDIRIIFVLMMLAISSASPTCAQKIDAGSQTLSPASLKNLNIPDLKLQVPAQSSTGSAAQQAEQYLVADLKDAKATIATDAGEKETLFNGEIAFQVEAGQKGELALRLKRFNLVSKGVETKQGSSGVIGLALSDPEYKVTFDQRKGTISSDFQTTLHYALIDKVKGFIPGQVVQGKGEADVFYSYTESMKGKFAGSLPENLKLSEKGSYPLDGVVQLELDNPVLGSLKLVTISFRDLFMRLTSPSERLTVQPIFIGHGPSDPAATGRDYPTLIRRAADMWNRCGTVRCLSILTNDPIYLDDESYKVLDGSCEAMVDQTSNVFDLLYAVPDDPAAIEIFVVERWDPLMDGCGATFSSGTASAKIVTSDQQLDVPCPAPCGCSGYNYAYKGVNCNNFCPCGTSCAGAGCGDVNYYHLAHELGHVLDLYHPWDTGKPLAKRGSYGSVMEGSGFCLDNPNAQSAKNCRSASNPLLSSSRSICTGTPDIAD
jgi:hypothetical protein